MRFRMALVLVAGALPAWTLGAQATGARRPATRPEPARPATRPEPATPKPTPTPVVQARASAFRTNTSLALKVGTLGASAELSRLLSDHLGLRLGANVMRYTHEIRADAGSTQEVVWTLPFRHTSFSGLIDIYPGTRGVFRLTGGAMTTPVKVNAVGRITTTGSYSLSGRFYSSAQTQIGDFLSTAEYASVVPYAGFGFGTPAASNRGLGFVLDIGVAIGKPTLTLTSTSAATTNLPTLRQDLASKEEEWRTEIVDKIPVWPVLSLGLSYRF